MRDNTFDSLANEHRRRILLALLEVNPRDGTVHVPTTGDSTGRDAGRVRDALYHAHLPKLVDYGYVRWDEATGEVGRGPRFGEVRPLLEFVAEEGHVEPP